VLAPAEPLSETRRLVEQGDADAQYQLAWEYCGDFDHLNHEDYANAARCFRRAGEQGHAKAQFELATLYYEAASWESSTGWARDLCKAIAAAMWGSDLAVLNNQAEAARWFRRAAEQGHARAQCSLGYLHQTGRGLRQDLVQAVRWYRRAAKQGHSAAHASLGGIYYQHAQRFGHVYAGAAKWFRKAAELGHASAQSVLGYMYYLGQGIEQNYAEAAKWYRKAAEQGIATAQHNLGVWYHNGNGVSQDYAEAVRWYRKAAEQGVAASRSVLGYVYGSGQGVHQDYVMAHMWIDLAISVSTGDDQKRYSAERDVVAAKMTPHQITEAQALAREWKPKLPG
jgi:TPR repeat protein